MLMYKYTHLYTQQFILYLHVVQSNLQAWANFFPNTSTCILFTGIQYFFRELIFPGFACTYTCSCTCNDMHRSEVFTQCVWQTQVHLCEPRCRSGAEVCHRTVFQPSGTHSPRDSYCSDVVSCHVFYFCLFRCPYKSNSSSLFPVRLLLARLFGEPPVLWVCYYLVLFVS